MISSLRLNSILLLGLLAGACLANANILNKLDDVKDKIVEKVTGNSEAEKDPVKESESEYQGGMGKQVLHSVADVVLDRMASAAKDQSPNALLKPVIGMAASKIKDKVHDKINDFGVKSDQEKQEPKPEEPKEEPKDEEKKGLGEMLGLSRRKRSADKTEKAPKKGLINGLIDKVFKPKTSKTTPSPVAATVAVTKAPATTGAPATEVPTTASPTTTTEAEVNELDEKVEEPKEEEGEETEAEAGTDEAETDEAEAETESDNNNHKTQSHDENENEKDSETDEEEPKSKNTKMDDE